jgi:hypothetical protein
MEDKKQIDEQSLEKKTFMQKYAFLILILGIAAVFTILKLLGFPEIMY